MPHIPPLAAVCARNLSITSAEKRCGKTRLLEVLSLLVANPWFTGSVSRAALVRKLDSQRPTLLLDESDAAFARDKDYSEALRAVLNSGHSREGVASLCVGPPTHIECKDFQVFGPKAIAGIGKLPDTVVDRAIPIRMKRRTSNEQIERFRRRLLKADGDEIQKQIATWITPRVAQLKNASPALPDALSDRQQDGCEPLLAIADVSGSDWPQKSRDALLQILTGEAAEDNSIGVRLWANIGEIFDEKRVESLSTSDLLSALCDENPMWRDFSYGKELSAASLARLLKPYGIAHRKLRIGEATPWGYQRSAFEDAWARYLPRNLEQVEQNGNRAANTRFRQLEHQPSVPALEKRELLATAPGVPDVPDSSSSPDRGEADDYLFSAAVKHCQNLGRASVNEITKALGVKRAEAVRYMDEMERRGLVPPAQGPGPRPFSPPTAAEIGFSNSPCTT